jgi:leucyl/phenylalanyl-tRNA--protein transferase
MTAPLDSLTNRIKAMPDALRAAGVIGPLARVRLIRLLIRTSSTRPLGRIDTARRSGAAVASFVPPTAADLVGQYLCGNVLFGTDDGPKWKFYDERVVITSETARLPRRIRRDVRNAGFDVRFDTDFGEIIRACGHREDNWLTPRVIELYEELHSLGIASCVGAYRDGELVGGIWGLDVGRVLAGMSMFHSADSGGTTVLAAAVEEMGSDGRWDMIDVGVNNALLTRLGAIEVPLTTLQHQLVGALAQSPAGAQPAAGGKAAAAIASPASP